MQEGIWEPDLYYILLYGMACVELSTEYNETEIHVVGLFIDPANTELQAELAKFRDNRDNRNLKMIEKLQEEGFRITAEDLYRLNPDTVVARPHIARYLVDSGQVKDLKTVFDKYIGDGCKCYVDRYKITPMQAVALIHQAGGLAILAHPCLYKMKRAELTAMIEELVAAGLNGIEVVYSCNQGSDEKDFRAMAEKYHLLLSGGSDFLGVPIEHAVAIGDEENDISMIRNAGVGVAMKNAVQSVKDAADYITEHDNNEDGVAEVIEKFSPDIQVERT